MWFEKKIIQVKRVFFALVAIILVNLAAIAVDNTNEESLLTAPDEHSGILEDKQASGSDDVEGDRQIDYDIEKLKSEKLQAEIEKQEAKISFGYKLICVSLLSTFILAIAVFMLHRKYVEERSRVKHLEKEIEKLEGDLEWAEHVNTRYDNLHRHDMKKDKK